MALRYNRQNEKSTQTNVIKHRATPVGLGQPQSKDERLEPPSTSGQATLPSDNAVSFMCMTWLPVRTGELTTDKVRDNRAAGDVVIVGADKIAKLSAETSENRAPAASCSPHCYPTSLMRGKAMVI